MTNEENKKNYCVAIIFKNGMKITSQLTTKRKATQCYFEKRSEFKSNYKTYMELEGTIFKTEDIFIICILPKKYRKWLKGYRRMTNEKHIKSMNTNQLAKFLQRFDCSFCPAVTFVCKCSDRYINCLKNIEKWLEKEILE